MILLVQSEENYIYNATVNVQVGENVTLLCSTSATYQKKDLRVYWQREQPPGRSNPDVVLAFHQGAINFKNQKDSYSGRVDVNPDHVASGNFSLLLESVQLEDSGPYDTVIVTNGVRLRCRTQLNVGGESILLPLCA